MQKVLITGARGFVGRNLVAQLKRRSDIEVREFARDNSASELTNLARDADVVVHLAGANRPINADDFQLVNAGLTEQLCEILRTAGRKPRIIFSSSIQAVNSTPYGNSKLEAERILQRFSEQTHAPLSIFRLKNVFGKWCRPNYNSAVATFCYHIARDQPIEVSDPKRIVDLVHVDDVVNAVLSELDTPRSWPCGLVAPEHILSHSISLGELVARIQSFRRMQQSLEVLDMSLRFNQQLYGTYLSYVPPPNWQYGLSIKSDERGNLAEFIKSTHFGQIFVSRTKPGVTRGNHYHHGKTEKFLVLAGEGVIRFRHIEGTEILEYYVRGEDYQVLDIPPGYTHSITNIGNSEMITLFWASEIFDPGRPDTNFLPV